MQSQPPEFAFLLLFVVFFIIVFIFSIVMNLLLVVLPFWKICEKAGFHGAMSLLMIVPFGNIFLPFFLAFSEWPCMKNAEIIKEK